ncbi:MAG: hypothetical protein PGN24_05885 [Microbacterium arborescens]
MHTVVPRRPSVAPSAPAIPEPADLRRLTITQRVALRVALRLIVWSARERATSSPAVAMERELRAAREERERLWMRSYLLTPYR